MANRTQVMSEFATLISMESLEPDETDLYSLLVDDDYTVFLQALGEVALIISTGIGVIPEHEAAATCRALLESNNFWLESGGFSLSLVPGSLQVLLSARADFTDLTGERLAGIFGRFAVTASDWRRRLPTIIDDSPSRDLAAVNTEAAAQQDLQEASFIRV